MPNNMKTTIGIMFFLPLVCQRCRRRRRLIAAATVTNRNTNTIDVDAAVVNVVVVFSANLHNFICL